MCVLMRYVCIFCISHSQSAHIGSFCIFSPSARRSRERSWGPAHALTSHWVFLSFCTAHARSLQCLLLYSSYRVRSMIQSADSEPQGSSSTGLTSDVAVAQSPQVRHVQQPALPLHPTPAILGTERWPSSSVGIIENARSPARHGLTSGHLAGHARIRRRRGQQASGGLHDGRGWREWQPWRI